MVHACSLVASHSCTFYTFFNIHQIKNKDPLVSVIIPCYNAERYVEAAVGSIINQTYRNLEIIVIDDCSTDATLTILKSIAASDNRVKLLRNEINLKLVATLNKGIEIASGEYLARMDADDISLSQRIERQVAFMEAHKEVGLCGAFYIRIGDNNIPDRKISFPVENEELKAELLFGCPFAHPLVIIRKIVLDKVGTYREGLVPAEDYELWLRIAEKFKVANLPEYLLHYRWHGDNITIKQKSEQAFAINKIFELHIAAFAFADKFLQWHLKFLEGTWNKRSVEDVLNIFASWKKELMAKNKKLRLIDEKTLSKVFDRNHSLALLSILKSSENAISFKLKAAFALIKINPRITIKNILQKLK